MSLHEIQIRLGEDVLQTLVIGEDFTMISNEKVSPGFQCMHYGYYLQIMRSVIQLMRLKLS